MTEAESLFGPKPENCSAPFDHCGKCNLYPCANKSEVAFEFLLNAILDVSRQLQLMIDSIVAVQEFMPMPKESWERFVRDIEYTNRKHGLNLQVPERENAH